MVPEPDRMRLSPYHLEGNEIRTAVEFTIILELFECLSQRKSHFSVLFDALATSLIQKIS